MIVRDVDNGLIEIFHETDISVEVNRVGSGYEYMCWGRGKSPFGIALLKRSRDLDEVMAYADDLRARVEEEYLQESKEIPFAFVALAEMLS